VLTAVFTADDWQSFADSGSDHEGIRSTEAILIRLGQREFFKVKSQLANIRKLLDSHLTSVGFVLLSGILTIHEQGLILECLSAAGEFE